MTYVEHFVKAAKYSGYVILPTLGAGQSPMAQALSAARSKLTSLSRNANWDAITEHVSSLQGAGIAAVGFEHAGWTAREQGFHVLALRQPPNVDIRREQAFVGSFGPWLDELKGLLPSFALSGDAQAAVTSLVSAAGLADPLLSAGLAAVLTFAQSSGSIKCLSVVPASSASGDFVKRWQATDLVSEPMFRPWIIEWLWNVEDNTVLEPGHGPGERSDRTLFGGAKGLQNALMVTGG
ncbi:MAG: hypothetical protein ACR2N4_15875 [Jatrophihabitans sp.]